MGNQSFKVKVLAAFASIYIIWGSTYLGIRFAIETIPPFFMAGIRFVIAGAILYAWARLRGAEKPSFIHWRSAAVIGALLLFLGNGGVTWSEQRVPSGIAALLIATVPLWIVLQDWLWHGAARPSARVIAGLITGLIGMLLLVGPGQFLGEGGVDLIGVGVLMIATSSWAAGSLYSRKAKLPDSPFLSTAMEMLAGGFILLLFGFVTGVSSRMNPDAWSVRSTLALGYLIIFGSLVAFTAYVWLLRVVATERVATYAYVNPIIAMLLGWGFAGEQFTTDTLLAALAIIVAVILIITSQSRRPPTVAFPSPPVIQREDAESEILENVG